MCMCVVVNSHMCDRIAFSFQQSSHERHGEHPPLPLPGCHLLHDWTIAGCGPPSLPGLLLGSSAAQHCLLVRSASTDPFSGLHRCTDTLCLYGCADPSGSRSVRLNIQKRGTEVEVVWSESCQTKQEEASWEGEHKRQECQ